MQVHYCTGFLCTVDMYHDEIKSKHVKGSKDAIYEDKTQSMLCCVLINIILLIFFRMQAFIFV